MSERLPDINRPTVGALMDEDRRRDQLERIDRRLAAGREPVRVLRRLGRPVLALFRGGRR